MDSIGPSGTGPSGTSNNDDWANQISIAEPNFSVTGANFNATTERDEPDLVNVGSTVWWSVTAEANGSVAIDTFGSDFDTELHVYEFVSGGGLDDLNLIAENDDTNGSQSQVSFSVIAGTRYEIRVGGFRAADSISAGSEGNVVLNGTFTLPAILLGDVSRDGVVDFLDISPFIALLSAGEFQEEADLNEDGVVDFLDISPFIEALSAV